MTWILVRKQQKYIFRTSVQGIEIPLRINRSALGKHDRFREKLVSVEDALQNDNARAAFDKSIEAMDGVIEQLKQPFDEELLVAAAQKSETALRELVAEIQKPTLVDSMEVFTADFEPTKLNVLQDGEELPTDEAEFGVDVKVNCGGWSDE